MSRLLDDRNDMAPARYSSWPEPAGGSRVEMQMVVVPSDLLERYVDVAMRGAVPRTIESGRWYADLPGFPGVWADGESPKQCLDTLVEVFREWVLLKIADEDRDLPPVDDIDLRALFGR